MKKIIYILIYIFIISCSNSEKHETADNNAGVLFLWLEYKSSESTRFVYQKICLNQDYIDTITDEEKAAIAYVATFVGNECYWDGEPQDDLGNLKCRILTALDLGYQCSEKHLDFLNYWFRSDTIALRNIKECGLTPYTATVQDTFDEIRIYKNEDVIIISFKAKGICLRDNYEWAWKETINFRITNQGLIIERVNKKLTPNPNILSDVSHKAKI